MRRLCTLLISALLLAGCAAEATPAPDAPASTPAGALTTAPATIALAQLTPAQPTAASTDVLTDVPATTPPEPATTPQPSATPIPPPSIGNQAQAEQAAHDDRLPKLILLAQEQLGGLNVPNPDSLVDVTLPGAELLWDNYWCAADVDILVANLAQLKFAYTFEGQPLDVDTQAFAETLVFEDKSACQITYFYLANLAEGQAYTLTYTFTASTTLDDGFDQYPPGDYRYVFTVVPAPPTD